jgi:hypothetical protein
MGIKTQVLRRRIGIARADVRAADYAMALRLEEKGYSNMEIGRRMNRNESSVRALLDPALKERSEIAKATSEVLKKSIDKYNFIDVGLGIENHLGISNTKLQLAVERLKDEGYPIHYLKVPQAGTGKYTSYKVLGFQGSTWLECNAAKDKIKMPTDWNSRDGGRTYLGLNPIQNVDSKSIFIRYKEDGGSEKDGVIELRRGVDELSLGNNHYAQVRIGVDGTHFMKGMAIYGDNIPEGYNIVYNTNKGKNVPAEKVFKSMVVNPDTGEIDLDNPFGSAVKREGQRGALNILNEEGDWADWRSKNTLSAQMLSKQKPKLIKTQLDETFNMKTEELDEIMSLTNPSVKKKLLDSFAGDCDASAVHLLAASLPRQGSHVMLPFPTMKEDQIYAPNYNDGEHVVLIRYPHGGTFEIPELIVNNKFEDAKNILGRAQDAIGIHPKVAERLSGADFDGDSVLVIPTNGRTITTSSPLKGLLNFDPKSRYPEYPGMVPLEAKRVPRVMGDISNLITDMTIRGADDKEIAAAVRHSMVVIDAEKHKLNYKQSAIDNNIAALKKKYQGKETAGASTLISKAGSEKRVLERKDYFKIDPITGKKVYERTNATYTNKKGKVIEKTTLTTRMAEEEDAFKLSSGTIQENIYAEYANKLKSMANKVRLISLNTAVAQYSPSANKTYHEEVLSLKAKLNIAQMNAPIERQAQLFANKVITSKFHSNPNLSKDAKKKIKGLALVEARYRTFAKKERIIITPKEWEAIQAHAVSNNVLKKILDNTDLEKIREYATPRTTTGLTPAKLAIARARAANGYTQAEIALSLGVSTSLLAKELK